MMKGAACLLSVLLFVSACGCQSSPNRAAEGAAVGGIIGAGAGAVIGHQSKHGGQGALLGGTIGALAGALAGSQMQKEPQLSQQPQVGETQLKPAAGEQMTVGDIIDLTEQGVDEETIVGKIYITKSKFSLTPEDMAYLKQKGVSQKVLDAMQGI